MREEFSLPFCGLPHTLLNSLLMEVKCRCRLLSNMTTRYDNETILLTLLPPL